MEGTTAKKPSRRLLNLKKPNKATKNITERNAEESWFLRLPAEIRNRIYEYSMGGRDLHLDLDRKREGKIRECKVSEDEFVAKWKEPGFVKKHDLLHDECQPWNNKSTGEELTLSLLAVCRPIYAEAALIPFASNRFIATSEHTMEKFTKVLMPVQQRALQDLHLFEKSQAWYENHYSAGAIRNKHFTGLRHLCLHLEFRDNQEETERAYENFRKGFRRYAQGQLKSVDIVAYRDRGFVTRGHGHHLLKPVQKQETFEFIEQLKSELLLSKEELEAKRVEEKAAQAKRKQEQEDEREQKRAKRALRQLQD